MNVLNIFSIQIDKISHEWVGLDILMTGLLLGTVC